VERPSHRRLLARQSLVQGVVLILEGWPVHPPRQVEREPEGNVHFAGEHTSVNSQGYLNGAVETGQRAAQELLSA